MSVWEKQGLVTGPKFAVDGEISASFFPFVRILMAEKQGGIPVNLVSNYASECTLHA